MRELKLALLVFFIGFGADAQTSTLTINSGSTLLISGGEHEFDCSDVEVIIKSGGTLEVSGGVTRNLNVSRESGSVFIRSGGTVTECDDFFIIKTDRGTVVVPL